MRTLRLSLVGTVILALASIPVALGQAEEPPDPMAPAIAKIEVPEADQEMSKPGTLTEEESGAWRYEDLRQKGVWEATDPRLSGVVTTVDNWHGWRPSGQGMSVEPATYELANDGGRWTGTGTGLTIEGLADLPHGQLVRGMILLSGEDGYEGLSALVHMDWSDPFGDPVIYGVIFPGEMPYPEPIEPSAAEAEATEELAHRATSAACGPDKSPPEGGLTVDTG